MNAPIAASDSVGEPSVHSENGKILYICRACVHAKLKFWLARLEGVYG